MKVPLTRKRLLCLVVLLAAVPAAGAQNIYKCSHGGQLEYTDRPCPGGSGELIHQADDGEIIDQYLRLGQDVLAKQYADSHHLEALYKERLAARQRDLEEDAQRREQEAVAAQQREAQAQQQALADEAANRDQLQAENDALRQQNEQYRDQLAQPAYNGFPAYWGAAPFSFRNHRHGRDRDHHGRDQGQHPPPSKQPTSHPCTQLAGGRVRC
jgi:hypothetical protein